MSVTAGEIRPLTGLRFLAALSVVVYHYGSFATVFPALRSLERITSAGRLGVDVFFILSGFILTYVYSSSFRELSRKSYLRFLGYRLARIYPVHLFTIGILLGTLVIGTARGVQLFQMDLFTPDLLAANLALVHAWAPNYLASWNGPSWSISAEWFAYLLFPFGAWLLARATSARWLLGAAVAAMLAQLLIAPIVLGHEDEQHRLVLLRDEQLALLRIAGEFALGCLLARLYLLNWAPELPWAAIAAVALVLPLVIALSLPDVGPTQPYRHLMIPVFGVIILAFARSANRRPASWFATPAWVFLGEASYALYMVHWLVLIIGLNKLPIPEYAGASAPTKAAVLAAYAVATFALAIGTYLWIERPARSALRRAISREWARRRPLRVVPLSPGT